MKKAIRAAVDIYSTFRGAAPKRLQVAHVDIPEAVAVIGHLDYVGYRTTYEGESELYEHQFQPGSRPLLCVSHDGKQLILLGGRYVFDKHHGIVDKDARGRKVMDPQHGQDIGFMRRRQANPANRWKGFIGYEVRDRNEKRLGKITAIEKDGGKLWATVDDDYQEPLEGACEVADLKTGKSYIRLAGGRSRNPGPPALPMNPGEDGRPLRQKDVFAAIRQMGLTVKKTEYDEFRVTYKGVSAKKAESAAYYTNDLADLLGTARAMVRAWNAQHARR